MPTPLLATNRQLWRLNHRRCLLLVEPGQGTRIYANDADPVLRVLAEQDWEEEEEELAVERKKAGLA